jgi:carbonic anhydrase
MDQIDRLLDNAAAHAQGHADGDLPARPARRVAVLACMDARLDPQSLLGLAPGDAHVIRNAGGVVSDDAIRSLAISQALLGTEEVLLIHHTQCGMLAAEEEMAAQLEQATGARPEWPVHAFEDLEADVRAGIEKIRSSPHILHKEVVRGFVYEVETGALREVSPEG